MLYCLVAAMMPRGTAITSCSTKEMEPTTKDRPTASDRAAIEKRYTERYDKYLSLCDRRVDGAKDAHLVAKEIAEDFLNENIYN